MRTKLRSAPTAEDLATLKRIHRELQDLARGFHPSAIGYAPLFACIATVQACGAEWSGNASVWRERDSIRTGSTYEMLKQRADSA